MRTSRLYAVMVNDGFSGVDREFFRTDTRETALGIYNLMFALNEQFFPGENRVRMIEV